MNIYVGNLDYEVDEHDLKDIFGEYGFVSSAKIITDRGNGRSKGFGFVEMEEQADGEKAIQELNGATLENRTMVVNEAKEKKKSFHRN
jgi:RNA recognition motif-containing protein